MNTNPYIDRMKLEKRSYDKRSQYSLLIFIFVILPLATYLSDNGWHIKSVKEQLNDFGELGTPLFQMFAIIVVLLGLHGFWKAKQLASKISHEEWREWEAKNRKDS